MDGGAVAVIARDVSIKLGHYVKMLGGAGEKKSAERQKSLNEEDKVFTCLPLMKKTMKNGKK